MKTINKFLVLKRACLSVLVVFLFSSCTENDRSVGSEPFSVRDFYTSFIIVDDGSDELYAKAQLTVGGPPSLDGTSYLDLSGGDELRLAHGLESIYDLDLTENIFEAAYEEKDKHYELSSANDVTLRGSFLFLFGTINQFGTFYSTSYPRSTSDEQIYSITLSRDGGDKIHTSSVAMPNSFDLLMPSSGYSVNRVTEPLELLWSDPDASSQIQISASISCLNGSYDTLIREVPSDSGGYIFPVGELDSMLVSGTCSTTITVAKVKLGSLNSAFLGGIIQGQQVRKVVIQTTD